MYTYIFKAKLKQLNDLLYLREDAAAKRDSDRSASGIYTRVRKHEHVKSDYNQLDSEGRAWLEAKEHGTMDAFVTACPNGWVPEYDQFDLDNGRILAKGWRTIALHLVKEKHCSLERAQRIFTSSLGEHTWDKASYEQRLAMARKVAGWKSTQDHIAAFAR